MYGDTSKNDLFDRLKLVLGEEVRKRRKELSLSQEELGLRLGADQAYVSRLESGQLNPTLESLAEVSASLEINLSSLLTTAPD